VVNPVHDVLVEPPRVTRFAADCFGVEQNIDKASPVKAFCDKRGDSREISRCTRRIG
jgi:hypothetical protein